MKFLKTVVTLAVIGLLIWLVTTKNPFSQGLATVSKEISGALTTITANVVTPGPLRVPFVPQGKPLTRQGVIQWTNTNRATNGRTALTENATLDKGAEKKLADMFAKQYFEHVSPSGVGPGQLAASVGYQYAVIGENLALGNFDGDKDLVTAWMNSPGHRANILNPQFIEIGVAVGQGTFEGKTVWLAVQEFGKPAASCPSVSSQLKAQIDADQQQLDAMNVELASKRSQLQNNQQVDAYNAEVRAYNDLLEQTKTMVADYNTQVSAYNACIGS